MENSMEVPQKIKNRTTIGFINSLLGIYPKKNENTNLKSYLYLHIHCSIIYNSQDMEAAWMSINSWMDKEDVVHIHNGILLSYKKNEILPFAIT